MTTVSTPTRGRPRDESCGHAILDATIALVAEVGMAGLTVDAVALRAGVSKATIYRRWSSKEAMLLDAWASIVTSPDVPDTGSLRCDLLELFATIGTSLPDDVAQRVFPQMIAAARVHPEVREAYRAYIAERRRPMRTVLLRAVERGELPADVSIDLVQDLLVAPLTYRFLITDVPLEPTLREQIVDLVLAGVRATAAVGSVPTIAG